MGEIGWQNGGVPPVVRLTSLLEKLPVQSRRQWGTIWAHERTVRALRGGLGNEALLDALHDEGRMRAKWHCSQSGHPYSRVSYKQTRAPGTTSFAIPRLPVLSVRIPLLRAA